VLKATMFESRKTLSDSINKVLETTFPWLFCPEQITGLLKTKFSNRMEYAMKVRNVSK